MKLKLWPGSSNLISTFQKCLNNQNSQSFNFHQNSSQAMKAINTMHSPRWLMHEDYAIIMALLYLQELPCNLSIVYPAHIPNWEFVAEQVNTYNTFTRPEMLCRYRYETIISPKIDSIIESHEGKTALHSHILNAKQSKSTKKSKTQQGANQQQAGLYMTYPSMSSQSITLNPSSSSKGGDLGATAPSKGPPGSAMANANATHFMAVNRVTKHLNSVIADNNAEFTREMNKRFDAIKQIVISKTPTSKSRFNQQNKKTFDHVGNLMNVFNINYHQPKSVEDLAHLRQERINKDHLKQKQQAREHQNKAVQMMNIPTMAPGQLPPPHQGLFHGQSSQASTSAIVVPGHVAGNMVGSPAHQQQIQQQQQKVLLNPATISNLTQMIQQQQLQQQQQQQNQQVTVGQNVNAGLQQQQHQQSQLVAQKGHQINSSVASIVGRSAVVSAPNAAASITPVQLQQVVNSQAGPVGVASSSGQQQQTFSISVQQITAMQSGQQGGPVQFAPITLKTPTSLTAVSGQQSVSAGTQLTTPNVVTLQGQQQQTSSALVAALSQSTPSRPSEVSSFQSVTTSANATLRTLTSLSSASNNASPIMLMQSQQQLQQNANIITQSVPTSVSLLTTDSSPMNPTSGQSKITSFTQTSSSPALSSILNTQVNLSAGNQVVSSAPTRLQMNAQNCKQFLLRQQQFRPQFQQQQQQQLSQQVQLQQAAIRGQLTTAQGRQFQMQNIRQTNPSQRVQIKVLSNAQGQQQGQQTATGIATTALQQNISAGQKGHIIISGNQLVGQSIPTSVSLITTDSSTANASSSSPMNPTGSKITSFTQTSGSPALSSMLSTQVNLSAGNNQVVSSAPSRLQMNAQNCKQFLLRPQFRPQFQPQQQQQQQFQQVQQQQATIRGQLATAQGRQFQLASIRQTNPSQRVQIKVLSNAQSLGQQGQQGQLTTANSTSTALPQTQKGHIIISGTQMVSTQSGGQGGVSTSAVAAHIVQPSALQQVVSNQRSDSSPQQQH